jgi:hypothetical protein
MRRITCPECGAVKPTHPEDAARGLFVRYKRGRLTQSLRCDYCCVPLPAGSEAVAISQPSTMREWEAEYFEKPQPKLNKQNMKIREHLNMLGLKVEDRVTGFKGIVRCVSFDLYGCIQAAINPGMGKDGTVGESFWYDIKRLKVLSKTPVMELPNFDFGIQAEGRQGPADKPAPRS